MIYFTHKYLEEQMPNKFPRNKGGLLLIIVHSDILTKKTCPSNLMALSAYAVPEL